MAQGFLSVASLFIFTAVIHTMLCTLPNDQCPVEEPKTGTNIQSENAEKKDKDNESGPAIKPKLVFDKIGANDLHISRYGPLIVFSPSISDQ